MSERGLARACGGYEGRGAGRGGAEIYIVLWWLGGRIKLTRGSGCPPRCVRGVQGDVCVCSSRCWSDFSGLFRL